MISRSCTKELKRDTFQNWNGSQQKVCTGSALPEADRLETLEQLTAQLSERARECERWLPSSSQLDLIVT